MNRVQEVFEYIKKSVKDNGFPPSSRQIADELKIDYETEVRPAIDSLIADGKIVVNNVKEIVIDVLD